MEDDLGHEPDGGVEQQRVRPGYVHVPGEVDPPRVDSDSDRGERDANDARSEQVTHAATAGREPLASREGAK